MQTKISKRKTSIPKGWFKLSNRTRVYITHSGYGHYPAKNGKKIIEEIKRVKPKYLLVEIHPSKVKNTILPHEDYKKEKEIPDKKRSDVGWAIIAGHTVGSEIVGFDIPEEELLKSIYKSFLKYSKRLAIISVIAHPMCSIIWHKKSKDEKINLSEIYKKTEKYLLDFAPTFVKKILKKEKVKNLFHEWLNFTNLTMKEIISIDPHYFSALSHFLIRFPSRKRRDKYMIKMIKVFSKKGETAVVVGSAHINTWVKNNWIKKL